MRLGSGFVVTGAAAGAAGLVCTTGGCIILAGAGFGAGFNFLAQESIDCAYGQCGQFSVEETIGDAATGAMMGGTSGYLRYNLSIQLGADKTAIGFVSAANKYGAPATLEAASEQLGELGASLIARLLIAEIFN